MRETWYVLEDGTPVHPRDVAPNADGALAHKSGLVAMRPDGETPRSRSVDVDESAKVPAADADQKASDDKAAGDKAAADAAAHAALKTSVMKPEETKAAVPRKPYKTRQSKAR